MSAPASDGRPPPIGSQSRWALVTGGSRGIGAAIVRRLCAAGIAVAFTYRSNEAAAAGVARDLDGQGVWYEAHRCDVAARDQVDALAADLIARHGAPYAVINNAGQARDALLLNMSGDDWQAVIDTNLNGVYYVTQAFIKEMLVRGDGCVVLMSSAAALRANVGQANYAASKAALTGFCKSLAAEAGRFNVRVNVVAPGIVASDMTAPLSATHERKIKPLIPLRRFGDADDVARMVEYLLGPGGSYITGQCFAIDGGLTA